MSVLKTIREARRGVQTLLGVVILVILVAAIVLFVSWLRGCGKDPGTTQRTDDFQEAIREKPHVRGDKFADPLPVDLPDEDIAGVVKVVTEVTVGKNDTAGTVKRVTVWMPIPRKFGDPLLFRVEGDSTAGAKVGLTEFRDPRIDFELRAIPGVSADLGAGLSPFAAASFVTLWDVGQLGVGVDRFGLGVVPAVRVFREWCVFVKWTPLPLRFTEKAAPIQFGIGYVL